jgi:hypothetical protein
MLRPEMLKFHPYSILTGETMVGFVIFCVLIANQLFVCTKVMNKVPPELAFEYKAIVNIEIGLVLSEDHVLRDTALDVPLTEALTS